jgi:hypothetical protein
MSNSFKTRHQLGQFKQGAAAAAPRAVVRFGRRQQPVTQALLSTISRAGDRSGDSADSGRSAGSLRVMSLISSLVDIEVSALCAHLLSQPFVAASHAALGLWCCNAHSFPAPEGVPPTNLASAQCRFYNTAILSYNSYGIQHLPEKERGNYNCTGHPIDSLVASSQQNGSVQRHWVLTLCVLPAPAHAGPGTAV